LTKDIGFASRAGRNRALAVACAVLLSLCACHGTPRETPAKAADIQEAPAKGGASAGDESKGAEPKDAIQGVILSAQQVEKLGVDVVPAKVSEYSGEVAGYGTVIAHDVIATAVAELTTAQATERQSRAAFGRTQRLAGTAGATSADVAETAERQSATDSAALTLAQRRLSAVIGSAVAGKGAVGESVLQDLSSGKIKLIRATFPLSALRGPAPARLRAGHLDAVAPNAPHPSQGWTLNSVWDAPADVSFPGRSFFALLRSSDAGEGERLLVWAPDGSRGQQGVMIPAAAVLIYDGKYWCYVEKKPGTFVRLEVNTDRPVADGYIVTGTVAAGDKVVTTAAGLLLARETNPSTEAE
jgi:hypothetical protein